MRNSIIIRTLVFTCIILSSVSSCAINRVVYEEYYRTDHITARVVAMHDGELYELVVSLQEQSHATKERVYWTNWLPASFEIDDYNDDGNLDVEVISTEGESHIFLSSELGFLDPS